MVAELLDLGVHKRKRDVALGFDYLSGPDGARNRMFDRLLELAEAAGSWRDPESMRDLQLALSQCLEAVKADWCE